MTWINSMRKHPIASFILLTFVFSYIIFALIPMASIKNPSYQLLIIIGAYGIAIAAIVVSRVLNSKPTGINPIKRWGKFAILFFVILPFALFNPYLKLNLSDPMVIVLCSIISALSAFVLSSVFSRNTGVRKLMVSVGKWKINPVWYLIALFTWPIINITSNIINLVYTGQPISLLTANIIVKIPFL